jgi:hypothetical protein
MIMTNSVLPWDEIQIPNHHDDYNVRLVKDCGIIQSYWGRDKIGRSLFLIALEGDHRAQFLEQKVILNEIQVDLQQAEKSGHQNLVLLLERDADSDLFLALCESLCDSIKEISKSDIALAVALVHLKRWKTFLAGKNARILSPEVVRGLFAELCFLRQLYAKTLSHRDAITAWYGLDKIHQDFIFYNRAVEVKSLYGTDRNTVQISSEDQLESVQEHLFLVIYLLNDHTDPLQADSLNGLVKKIENELVDPELKDEFLNRLGNFGYSPMPEYEKPMFAISRIQPYRVISDFPKIVRSKLMGGIKKVTYQIELEYIESLTCDMNEVLGGS